MSINSVGFSAPRCDLSKGCPRCTPHHIVCKLYSHADLTGVLLKNVVEKSRGLVQTQTPRTVSVQMEILEIPSAECARHTAATCKMTRRSRMGRDYIHNKQCAMHPIPAQLVKIVSTHQVSERHHLKKTHKKILEKTMEVTR